MFPQEHRLPSYLVSEVRLHGKVLRLPFFDIYQKTNEEKSRQFAVIVSKSVHKHAVERNRMKRLLRTAIMHTIGQFPESYLGVIVCKRTLLGKTIQEIEVSIQEAFRLLGCDK